ncbi:MAG: hypothetical protein QOI41_6812 [Myxococcales bacterium]|nr:hypothetical protein [Myxococcales bacterium]
MPYREQSERPDEPEDPEDLAIATLTRRTGRLRACIHVPLLLLGIVGGGFAYVALRDMQFAARGMHMPWLTAIVSFSPTFGGSLWLAPRIANFFARRALRGWRAELAKKHGLDLAQLEETTRLLE